VRVRGKSGRYSAKVQVPASRKGALSRVINPQTVNQWSSNITSVMYFELDDCPVNTLRHARFITFTYDCVHSSICGRLFAGGPISLGTLSPIRIPADFGFRRDTTKSVPYRRSNFRIHERRETAAASSQIILRPYLNRSQSRQLELLPLTI
jgi:hypothetical protein